MSFAADPRLNFGSEGAIELFFVCTTPAARVLESLQAVKNPKSEISNDTLINQVLLANSDGNNTRFAVFLNENRTRIGLYNGEKFASIPYNFRDRKWHHVALITREDTTIIIADGQNIGTIEIGYGTALTLPLHMGNLDGVTFPFDGSIATVRLWDTAQLEAADFAENVSYGPVPLDKPMASSVAAFSMFTDQRREFHFTSELLDWTGMVNTNDQEIFEWSMKINRKPKRFLVRLDEEAVYGVGLLYGVVEGDSYYAGEAWFPPGSNQLEKGEVKAFELFPDEGESLIGIAGSFDQDGPIKSIRFITNQRMSELYTAAESGDIPYLIQVPKNYIFGGFQGQAMADEPILQAIGLGYKPDEAVAPLDLGHFIHELDGQPVRDDAKASASPLLPDHSDPRDGSLHLHGNYTSHPLFHFQQDMQGDWIKVEGEFPAAGTIELPISKWEKDEIVRLIETTTPFIAKDPGFFGPVTMAVVLPDSSKAVIDSIIHTFMRDLSNTFYFEKIKINNELRYQIDSSEFHALVNSIFVQDFQYLKANNRILVDDRWQYYNQSRITKLYMEWQKIRQRSIFQASTVFGPEYFHYDKNLRYVHENGSVLYMVGEDAYQLDAVKGFAMRSGVYRKIGDYQASNNEQKYPWGATFSYEQRPRLLDFNFKGYNIAKIKHDDYQLGTGTFRNVFQMIADTSRHYQYTSSGNILPYGLYFRPDREAMQRARSHTISSQKQHQKAWSSNLGMNIGVPGLSFSYDSSQKDAMQRMKSTKKMNALSMAFESKHAIVLDKARMPLDADFRQAVYRLRDHYLSYGEKAFRFDPSQQDPYGLLVQTYGTHYPYAVTYGGMAYQEVVIDGKTQESLQNSETSVKASASTSMEGFTLGGSYGAGNSQSQKTSSRMDNNRSRFRTVGGELSMGGQGGSWGLPDHSEVPVLLDLRPIYELLSPVYFEDELIWKALRTGLQENLYQFSSLSDWDEDSWDEDQELINVTVNIKELRNVTSGFFRDKYFGTIMLNDSVTAWCVRSRYDTDYSCPPSQALLSYGYVDGGFSIYGYIPGDPNTKYKLPINFSKVFYLSKDTYCNGSLTMQFDLGIDDVDMKGDRAYGSSTEFSDKTFTYPWRQFGVGTKTDYYVYPSDEEIKLDKKGIKRSLSIPYTIEVSQNVTCPDKTN